MSQYMEHTHLDAFRDIEPMEASPKQGRTIECPKCHTHGKWNLKLNSYGPGKHFQQHCTQCDGWGWVRTGLDATCLHDWQYVEKLGNCLHLYRCSKCNKEWEVDSSG